MKYFHKLKRLFFKRKTSRRVILYREMVSIKDPEDRMRFFYDCPEAQHMFPLAFVSTHNVLRDDPQWVDKD